MAIPEFDIGNVVRLSVVFKDIDLNLIDPSAVTLKIKPTNDDEVTLVYGTDAIHSVDFDESPTPYEVITAEFFYDFEITTHGDHYWRWEGSGTLEAANEGVFHARQSQF